MLTILGKNNLERAWLSTSCLESLLLMPPKRLNHTQSHGCLLMLILSWELSWSCKVKCLHWCFRHGRLKAVELSTYLATLAELHVNGHSGKRRRKLHSLLWSSWGRHSVLSPQHLLLKTVNYLRELRKGGIDATSKWEGCQRF